LDNLIAVSQQDSLLGTLPLLDVRKIVQVHRSLRQIILVKVELHGPKLGVAFEIRLEMLQQDDLLRDRVGVLKEVVLINLLDGCAGSLGLVTHSLNVDEVEQVRRGHDLRRVIEQDSKSSIR